MQQVRSPEDFIAALADLKQQLDTIGQLVDPEGTAIRIDELEQQMNAAGFWDDPVAAGKVGADHTRAKRKLEGFAKLQGKVEDIGALIDMAKESEGAEQAEVFAELESSIQPLRDEMERLQEESLFTGEFDAGDAIVSIQAGEGGVDAQDWAEMLVRMYLRFLERRGMKVEFASENAGDEAGIRSASFIVRGENAYGIMNAEGGVHRLVRLSPFDSAHRRQTSFAQVEVAPLIDDDVEFDLDKKDIREDTYRASGAGGQHVNKTDSAIRLTHIPTGVVVQCQNERSQHQNRDTAMKMLRSKLYELELQKREATISAEKGAAQNVGFGSQIRSYVLQPYQMVKDLRTRHETGQTQAVLDGDIDEFIRAYLLHKAQGGSTFRADATADLD